VTKIILTLLFLIPVISYNKVYKYYISKYLIPIYFVKSTFYLDKKNKFSSSEGSTTKTVGSESYDNLNKLSENIQYSRIQQ